MMELTESCEWHFPFGDESLGRDCLPLIPVLWGHLEMGINFPLLSMNPVFPSPSKLLECS